MINKDSRYLFPVYQTNDDLRSVGLEVTTYNDKKPRKHWIDTNPKLNEDGLAEYRVFAYAGSVVKITPSGLPKFTTLLLTPEDAKSFNIPDIDFSGKRPEPVQIGTVPTPLRELKENETWKIQLFGEPLIVEKESAKPTPVPTSLSLDKVYDAIQEVSEKLNRIMNLLGGN